jgi:hypothetical protein
LGVIPVGVFTTASVGYDNEINSNLGATVHDLETHWKFYLNISLTRGTPLSSAVHKVRNEVAAFVIDKLLEGSNKIQKEEIEVARVYQSIHEEGRGTMAKVLRGIILDFGKDWFARSVSSFLTPTEISEIYQIIGYKEQEEDI